MDTEKISFHIISYAGDSFSKMREALSEAKLGNFQKADELMSSAKKTLTGAHNVHTEVITLEAQGEKKRIFSTSRTCTGYAYECNSCRNNI